jgi:hypothetical protein
VFINLGIGNSLSPIFYFNSLESNPPPPDPPAFFSLVASKRTIHSKEKRGKKREEEISESVAAHYPSPSSFLSPTTHSTTKSTTHLEYPERELSKASGIGPKYPQLKQLSIGLKQTKAKQTHKLSFPLEGLNLTVPTLN